MSDSHWSDFKRPVRRWTAIRKAVFVDGLWSGKLDRDEMMRLHNISEEELREWMRLRDSERVSRPAA